MIRKRIWKAAAAVVTLLAVLLLFWRCDSAACQPAPQDAMPVLMYHHLVEDGKDCNSMTVTVDRMERDLQWLQDNGYHTVLPRELASGRPRHKKSVMITFDDGYRSNYELLFPLLKKYNMKAAIAVIVKKLDDGVENSLTWDMCREMDESGLVEIGSHTFGLHNLENQGRFVQGGINGIARIPHESDDDFRKRVLDDLQKSHDRIAAEIGDVSFFAFPYGVTEPDAESLLETLFPVTLTTDPGIADLQKGHQKLPRFAVNKGIAVDELL